MRKNPAAAIKRSKERKTEEREVREGESEIYVGALLVGVLPFVTGTFYGPRREIPSLELRRDAKGTKVEEMSRLDG